MERFVRAGDLTSGVFIPDRATAAIALHQRIQQSRPETYESEVVISHICESDPWAIHISGRIDGIFRYPDRMVLEEIKTTIQSPKEPVDEDNPHHWAQLKIYAYMISMEHDLESVDTCLTYAQLHSKATWEIQRTFSRKDLQEFVAPLISRLVRRTEDIRHLQNLRDQSIGSLKFPFEECRRGQQRMMEEVYQAIVEGDQLLVQAPTGIGKTLAVILPALKALSQGKIDRMFYLTARSTGKQVAEEAFGILMDKGLRLKTLTLTAKEKICFDVDAECNRDECDFAKGYHDRIDEAITRVFEIDFLSRDVIEKTARQYMVCPFELSLELSELADCIICDYNYVFDPQANLRRFFSRPREAYLFLVDEAHNLVDRSREMFSAEIRKQVFLDVRRQVKKALPDVYSALDKVNKRLLRFMKASPDKAQAFAETELPEDLWVALSDFVKACEKWLILNRDASFRDSLLELYFGVTRFLKVTELFDASYAVCCERFAKDFRVRLFCIDPSASLSGVLEKGRATIFFSATLTPTEYFQKTFGCGEASSGLVLASPFPRENLCVMVSGVSTFFRNRRNTKELVAGHIQSLVSQRIGNYLIFFPSYSYMTMVVRSFEALFPEFETLVQTPRLTEVEREGFLKKFSRDNSSTLVGFAVMGGVFGEGIDLVGDRLTGAAVVGVGMPPPNLERELINAYFTEQYDAGYEFAYIFPGFNKVLQASGRVIRSETDRGVILLIDRRFASRNYQSMFPEDWNPNDVRHPDDITRVLGDFWD
ncbi:MAG: ATP-dependent DNA helicase [Desulfobacterales bacterium]|nr:ATP-dependent DNA helicase [Desulfobacterales bacterium]MDX2510533.1 ATP-dependent DNA helicase [Desulfobacterales bacterium]